MQKKWKRLMAGWMAAILLCTGIYGNNVFAADSQNIKEKSTLQEQNEYLLNYMVVEQSCVQTPGTQNVVASIGDENVQIDTAVLHYTNRKTGEEFLAQSAEIKQDGIRFEMEYKDESQSGIYHLDYITYTVSGKEYTIYLDEIGMDIQFGVNQEVNASPDEIVVDEDSLDINIVTFDENGKQSSETDIADALEKSEETMETSGEIRNISPKGADKNIVVVLDPGHDDKHAGAQANGYGEEDLNLKIAQYCREELSQYEGVTVYMTRDDSGACPYPGTTSTDCNAKRVEFAQSVGADAYVSIHLNSGPSYAEGAMVYYPNTNYNPTVGNQGKQLATKILEKLVALGLYNRGISIRGSEDGTKYPDGSLADYYGVIRLSKLAGIPAIIIEHAFLTNTGDVSNFLNSEEKLKKLGVADAEGIAEYFGLSKKSAINSGGLYLAEHNNTGVMIGISTTTSEQTDLEYRWLVYDIKEDIWSEVSGWTLNNEWLIWNPGKSGDFLIQGEVRVADNPSSHAEYCIGLVHHQQIKGICQMPYTGPGGGYLIGVESYDNPNQSYSYELLILDCTLLAQNKPAWTYTTGRCGVSSGNSFWTIWQPQYGYYWTLFRVYDETGNLIDEECFPFVNAY